MTRRTERVGNVIQRDLGEFVQRELSDPRLAFLTFSRVEITPELSQAKVFVSVMAGEKETQETMAALADHAGRMRTYLSKRLKTRTVPRLHFVLDKNLDHGFRIAELLKDLDTGKAPPSASPESGEKETR